MNLNSNNLNSAHSTASGIFKWLCSKYPKQTIFILLGQAMSSISENISLVMLMPIIYYATGTIHEESLQIIQPFIKLIEKYGFEGSLAFYLVLFVIAIVIKALFRCFADYYTRRVNINIVAERRIELVRNTLASDWSYITKLKSGVLTNVITNEANKFEASLSSCFNWVVSIISIVLYTVTSLMISPVITFFSLITGLLIFCLFKPLSGITYKQSIKNTKNVNSMSSILSQTTYGLKALKAMALESRSFQLIKIENSKIIKLQEKISLANTILRTCQEPVVLIILSMILYFALTKFNVDIAILAVIALIFIRISNKVAAYQKAIQSIGNNAGSVKILFETIESAGSAKENISKNKKAIDKIENIIFKDISIVIDGKELLKNINLEFNKNSFSAVVGESGSGKTTLIDTILGFNKVSNGKILIDNFPLESIDMTSLRKNIGYIPQEVFLFNDTLKNNIVFDTSSLAGEEMQGILGLTGFGDYFAKEFSSISNDIVENGKNLSGGQKQKIALARALVKQPKLLILDEATSALDEKSANDIYEILKQVSKKIIVIAISHDKKIYDYADFIYELDSESLGVRKVA